MLHVGKFALHSSNNNVKAKWIRTFNYKSGLSAFSCQLLLHLPVLHGLSGASRSLASSKTTFHRRQKGKQEVLPAGTCQNSTHIDKAQLVQQECPLTFRKPFISNISGHPNVILQMASRALSETPPWATVSSVSLLVPDGSAVWVWNCSFRR